MKPEKKPLAPTIIHRDEHVLVLDKPAFLPTTSPDEGDCLVRRAHALDPRAERLHPTSRLDAEVTGVVTFARTTHAIEAIAHARATGHYRRRYIALASGVMDVGASLVWDGPIDIDPRDARRRVIADGPHAKASLTLAEPSCLLGTSTLLVLWPRTGRTHQLRLHASAAGHALLGDAHYGGPRRIARGDGHMVAFARVMLHCAEVVLLSLVGKGELSLRAPLPDDFVAAFIALGGERQALDEAATRMPLVALPHLRPG